MALLYFPKKEPASKGLNEILFRGYGRNLYLRGQLYFGEVLQERNGHRFLVNFARYKNADYKKNALQET